MRSTGESLASIAAALGVHEETVRADLEAELKARSARSAGEVRYIRQLELDRLDRWAKVQEARHARTGDPKAAEMLLRLQGRRLALLGVSVDPDDGQGRPRRSTGGELGAGEPSALLARLLGQAAQLGVAAGVGIMAGQRASQGDARGTISIEAGQQVAYLPPADAPTAGEAVAHGIGSGIGSTPNAHSQASAPAGEAVDGSLTHLSG